MAKHQANPSSAEVEEKFAQTAFRLVQERSDFLLPQILDFVKKNKWLNLQPEYQRRPVWDVKKKSLFIESLLLNIPIPPLFLYELELGRYEVMDGQQRLNSVVEFYSDGFALKGLEEWSEINGLRLKELPEILQRGLDRRRLSATVLLFEGNPDGQVKRSDIRKIIFERLNTGGQNLNAQEIRNCLFAGPFNKLLIRLSENDLFTDIWQIPSHHRQAGRTRKISPERTDDRLYRRMTDCEIVLRFFAFRERSKIRGSVRRILDDCMETNRDASPDKIHSMKSDFEERLELAHKIFGKRTFRYRDSNGEWKLSQPLFDAIMVALHQLWAQKKALLSSKAEIVEAVTNLFSRKRAYAIIVGRPNTSNAIRARVDLLAKTFRRAAGL